MAHLPESVQQLAEVIGEAKALELVEKLPRQIDKDHPSGRPVLYVPKTVPPDHRLVAWIGWDAAIKLSRYFGGELLFVATCAARMRVDRNAEIIEALKHASPAAVAAKLGIGERQVRRIAAKAKADNPAMPSASTNADHARITGQAIAA